MAPFIKTLATLALWYGCLEGFNAISRRIERKHYGHRRRIRAEKVAALITAVFVAGVFTVSIWSQ